MDYTLQAFEWSGLNSDVARETAGIALHELLKDKQNEYDAIHLIGHSHAGNVFEEALTITKFAPPSYAEKIGSITSVGTSYFAKRPSGQFQMLSFMFGMAFLLLFSFALFAWDLWDGYPNLNYGEPSPLFGFWDGSAHSLNLGLIVLVVIGMAVIGRSLPKALSFWLKRGPAPNYRWRALVHPKDEVLALLTTLAGDAPSIVPKRGFSNLAKRVGVIFIVGAIGVAGLVAAYFTIFFERSFRDPQAAVLIIASSVIAYSFLSTFGMVFDRRGRAILDNFVYGTLKSAAYGQDGFFELMSVQDAPYRFSAQSDEMTGDEAEQLSMRAQQNIYRLIDKNHTAVFDVSTSGSFAGLMGRLDTSPIWDALVHTRYFDTHYVADYCAASIAPPAS